MVAHGSLMFPTRFSPTACAHVPFQQVRPFALSLLSLILAWLIMPEDWRPGFSGLFTGLVAAIFLLMTAHNQEPLLQFIGRLLTGLIYRVEPLGLEHLPKKGGVLLLPNHLTWVDAILLQFACPRPIRFVVFEDIYNKRLLKPLFEALKAIPISPTHARQAIRAASDQLKKGEVVCIFPEGELSRTGALLRLKKGYEVIAKQGNCPVLPIWLDQLWGSIFSFRGGRFFLKWPEKLPYPVTVAFGEPLEPGQADIATVREQLLILGERCFSRRHNLENHLSRACVRGLKKKFDKELVIDGLDGSRTSAGKILAAGLTLATYLRKTYPDQGRIAIVLPPGRGAVVANLGVMLAGKVPVNLNFTAGRSALEASIATGDLSVAITAKAFETRLGDFPWPETKLYLEKTLPALKKAIIRNFLLIRFLPTALICKLWKLPEKGDQAEGVLLFTSGSSGEPKGVVLSHRNLLANTEQFGEMLNLREHDTILACLPFFHSFGCTVTVWYPLIEGIRIVTYPNPLEVTKNAELIAEHRVTLLLSTPTFLRAYIRKVPREHLEDLDLVITGAEKLPPDLASAFEKKFGHPVLEGYGLTETAPVVSANLPDPEASRPDDTIQPARRAGSVGKPAPGIAVQIRDSDTGERLPIHQSGMLWLRGSNIFKGYLNQPEKSAEVLKEGWFMTGDLGRVDEDGFLFIEGRLSRFSKIGGEMVPHETLEARVNATLEAPEGDRYAVVVGIPDPSKGEAIILLVTVDVDLPDLRKKLSAAGIPNLWIPKKVKRVEEIPTLGSGKLDLKECKRVATED